MSFAAAAAAQAATEEIKAPEKLPTVPGRKVHIDGDYLCYYASGNDETEPGMARLNALQFIQSAIDFTGSEKAVVHLTASGCHKGERYLAATVKPYQAQRSGDRRPKNWGYLREWATGYDGVDFIRKNWATREADDGIALCAEYAVSQGYLDAICTADKDMRMLPGLHLCWKDHQILTTVTADTFALTGLDGKLYGRKWFWLQMLMGDAADHIPGLEQQRVDNADGTFKTFKKIGEKGAEAVLKDCLLNEQAAQYVWDEYKRGYNSSVEFAADRFVEQACLLWLRRDREAHVCDFLRYTNPNDDIRAAAARLEERIKTAREALNNS